jgi:hypothetical protein
MLFNIFGYLVALQFGLGRVIGVLLYIQRNIQTVLSVMDFQGE